MAPAQGKYAEIDSMLPAAFDLTGNESEQEKLLMATAQIVKTLINFVQNKKSVDLNKLKTRICGKFKLARQPTLTDIRAATPKEYQQLLKRHLLVKPVRTASGVSVVAVMCKPHRCPHIEFTGNICVYCPGGPDSDFEYSTQSYTGHEPTSMRAIRARYDPYLQARHRIDQLSDMGHSVEKVEYIVMGGTFMALPDDYKDYFIRNLQGGLN